MEDFINVNSVSNNFTCHIFTLKCVLYKKKLFVTNGELIDILIDIRTSKPNN